MVLGPHREALDLGVGRGALGHSPRLEYAVGLEPEVPVEPGRGVFLDDEAVAALAAGTLARRFGGFPEIPLAVVFGKGIPLAHGV